MDFLKPADHEVFEVVEVHSAVLIEVGSIAPVRRFAVSQLPVGCEEGEVLIIDESIAGQVG